MGGCFAHMEARPMRIRLVLAILSFCGLVLLAAPPAMAVCTPTPGSPSCLGLGCNQLGATAADGDAVNIIACLKTSSTNPTPVWKSMSGSSGDNSPPGTLCGFAMTTEQLGVLGVLYGPAFGGPTHLPCKGLDISPDTFSVQCPSDYSPTILFRHPIPGWEETGGAGYALYMSCVKQ